MTAAPWFAPALAAISSVMTAFVLFAAKRMVGKAAWTEAVTSMNKNLIDQLQEERGDLLRERSNERIEWAGERAQLRGDVLNLTQVVESLKAALRREGIAIPEAAYHPAVEMTIIEGEKK